MKFTHLAFILIALCFGACIQPEQEKKEAENKAKRKTFVLTHYLFNQADSIIKSGKNPNIWNLGEIDTNNCSINFDHFSDSLHNDLLFYIKCNAGLSAGSASNLLVYCRVEPQLKIMWAGQMGSITEKDIKDLNGDGVLEIQANTYMQWMSECNESFEIFNFKNHIKNTFYEVKSQNFLDCYEDNVHQILSLTDTLLSTYEWHFVVKEKGTYVQSIRNIGVYNGGKNLEEYKSRLKTKKDTSYFKIY